MCVGLAETFDGGIDHHAAMTRLKKCVERVDAVLIGPGMTEGESMAALTSALCAHGGSASFALDAAALCDLRPHAEAVRSLQGRVVITPHAGEMAQLLGRSREEIEADPVAVAEEAAALLDAVVVMKGARSHIVTPDGRIWLFKGGGVGLATSGSGDVLAGLIAGLLARGADPAQAALWGVYLHGEAGAAGRNRGPAGLPRPRPRRRCARDHA